MNTSHWGLGPHCRPGLDPPLCIACSHFSGDFTPHRCLVLEGRSSLACCCSRPGLGQSNSRDSVDIRGGQCWGRGGGRGDTGEGLQRKYQPADQRTQLTTHLLSTRGLPHVRPELPTYLQDFHCKSSDVVGYVEWLDRDWSSWCFVSRQNRTERIISVMSHSTVW